MAITQQDIQPFINPQTLAQLQGYLPSYANPNLPTSGGPPSGGSSSGLAGLLTQGVAGGGGIMNLLTGGLAGLFGSKPGFQPYVDPKTGQYVFADPNTRNPVPVASVPGAPLKPTDTYKNLAANTQALQDLMPYLNQTINQGVLPSALADLQASQATSPGYAQLMTQLFNQYGPQLNAIGNEIQKQNMLSQAGAENQVLQGPGSDLVKNAYGLSQVYDKPFYDTRDATAKRIQDLLSSIDLSGGLSTTERNEIAQGLARSGVQRGTLNAPSASETVSNAMQYGQAGYQRTQQAKSNLAQAISAASGFLPASKSGVDVFQVATGRPSMPNPGQGLFPGINQTGNNSGSQFGLAGNLLGGMNAQDINAANIQANKKDWLDKFNQFASGLSSLTSSAGAVAGMCWVAREVFGINNPKWKQFRRWLWVKSPIWLFKWYLKHGERFTKFIHNKIWLKNLLRKIMNYAIMH